MTNATTPPPQRMISLDVLRGITIAFMILVNNPGDGAQAWRFLRHADWNGMTPTDLVFPMFLFVVGTSVVLAFETRLARGATRAELARHALRRAIVLFLLGVVVNGFPFFHLDTLRWYGVLQRIAITYLIAALLHLWRNDVASKIVVAIVLLLGYWVLMRWIPVPGYGVPGHGIAFLDPDANWVAWLDRHLFSADHLYERTRDPEGLLSTLPALATVLIGMLCGSWLRTAHSATRKALGLAAAAIVLLAAGYLWSLWFPLNKKLWTSSYVLVTAGWSSIALAACVWICDAKGWRRGWTFVPIVFGSNAIVAYMISELLPGVLGNIRIEDAGARVAWPGYVFRHVFAPLGDPGIASFAYALAYTALCFVPVWLLYRRRIFVKV